jgi:hypothetical protein
MTEDLALFNTRLGFGWSRLHGQSESTDSARRNRWKGAGYLPNRRRSGEYRLELVRRDLEPEACPEVPLSLSVTIAVLPAKSSLLWDQRAAASGLKYATRYTFVWPAARCPILLEQLNGGRIDRRVAQWIGLLKDC